MLRYSQAAQSYGSLSPILQQCLNGYHWILWVPGNHRSPGGKGAYAYCSQWQWQLIAIERVQGWGVLYWAARPLRECTTGWQRVLLSPPPLRPNPPLPWKTALPSSVLFTAIGSMASTWGCWAQHWLALVQCQCSLFSVSCKHVWWHICNTRPSSTHVMPAVYTYHQQYRALDWA